MAGIPIAAVLSGIGTAVSTVGQIQAGNAARRSANFQAAQMNQQAGQERATAQRAAIEQRRTARLAGSRATALAAASGGATDPTILNILGDIKTEGEYNALSALFTGEEKARGLEMGASARVVEGQTAKQASIINAGSTLSTGIGQSLMAKYGGKYGSVF